MLSLHPAGLPGPALTRCELLHSSLSRKLREASEGSGVEEGDFPGRQVFNFSLLCQPLLSSPEQMHVNLPWFLS